MADRWERTRQIEAEITGRIADQCRQPWQVLRNIRRRREVRDLLAELDAEIGHASRRGVHGP